MNDISARQQRIVDVIRRSIAEHGYPPTVREIGAAVGLRSTCTVHKHLNVLESKGYIRRNPLASRSIMLGNAAGQGGRMVELPVLGRVAAGTPVLAAQAVEETIALPETFTRGRDAFVLKVKGDSMVGDGINDGDYVVVARQNHAENGDLVVALISDEATVKRFYREAGRVRLQPANESYRPLLLDDVSILGKVIASFRVY